MSRIVIALGGNALGNNAKEQQERIEQALHGTRVASYRALNKFHIGLDLGIRNGNA